MVIDGGGGGGQETESEAPCRFEMHPQVVLTSSAPSISLLDYNTGTVLGSWKPTNSNARCTGVIPTRNGLGGVILAVQPDKPLLHAFAFQKVRERAQIHMPSSTVTVPTLGPNAAKDGPARKVLRARG